MIKNSYLFLSAFAATLLAAACSEPASEGSCREGALACPCSVVGSCDPGLICQAMVCSQPTAAGGTGVGGSSAGGAGGSASGAGGTLNIGGSVSGAGGTAGMGGTLAAGGAIGMGGTPAMGGAAGMGGSAGTSGAAGMGGAAGTGGSGGGAFTLTSSELMEGAAFLPKSTCAANGFDNDESPPLAWSGAPAETLSYALVFIDRTLVDRDDPLGYHWAVWDIPPTMSELPANLSNNQPAEASHSRASYLGPCPNFGSGAEEHSYEFILYAMPTAMVDVTGMLSEQMHTTLEMASIASATLSGTSDASPP